MVKLSDLGEEQYVSRSQAKRILLALDKFEKIILDFKDVKTVGQGFVDEVFRVFKQEHPNIEIEYVNANDNVLFMLKRGLDTPQ
ncbi:MAG: STAS-like domain-containing protein [Proteobacteria bacterium]|nr:STAS-like domain-containing protein [Pseudomonadota bacterium]